MRRTLAFLCLRNERLMSSNEAEHVRTYSIMSRARARAGVPLDLIKPKGPLKTPPRPVKKDIPKKQQQNNNNSGWHTAGLARTVAIDTVSSSTTTETKDPMPILTARQELRQLDRQENELIENSKIFFRRTRPLDLAEPPPDLDFALQDRDAVKKSSEEELFRQKIREMQLRKPAGNKNPNRERECIEKLSISLLSARSG